MEWQKDKQNSFWIEEEEMMSKTKNDTKTLTKKEKKKQEKRDKKSLKIIISII